MGQIANVSSDETELPPALTETEASEFHSGAYLADQPAIAAVSDIETVQFVVTNKQHGIAILRETSEHVLPDKRYQTVVVVTDRRVIALVGMEGGDREFTLDISEITDISTETKRRTGQITVDQADGPAVKIHTEADGLASVADYLRNQSDACQSNGRMQATTQSVRKVFGSTVNTAKSIPGDRVTKLLPDVATSPAARADTDSDELRKKTATDSSDADTGPTQRGSHPRR